MALVAGLILAEDFTMTETEGEPHCFDVTIEGEEFPYHLDRQMPYIDEEASNEVWKVLWIPLIIEGDVTLVEGAF